MKTYNCDKCRVIMEKPYSIRAWPVWKTVRRAKEIQVELCEKCYRKAVKVLSKHLGIK